MNKKALTLLTASFICLQLTFFILIFTTSGNLNNWVSFLAIVDAFIFSLCLFSFKKTTILTQTALLTTVISDLFLVIIKPQMQLIAMIFFSITQICYCLRLLLTAHSKKEQIIHISVRSALVVIVQMLTVIILREKTDALSLVSMFYFTNLVLNVIFAFIQTKKSVVFSIGLLCFMLCDIFVGLQTAIGVYINIPTTSIIYKIAFSPFNWVWFFYVPAQTLIALSLIFNRYHKNLSFKK